MSTLYTDFIQNRSGQQILPPRGNVVQMRYNRLDSRGAITFHSRSFENNGGRFPMSVTLQNITSPDNLALIIWQISWESNCGGDQGFVVLRNGQFAPRNVQTEAKGFEGYWDMTFAAGHDGDDSSTPHTQTMTYLGRIGKTGNVDYQLMIRNGSDGQCNNFYYNRPVGNSGSNNNEVGVSSVVAFEIANDGLYSAD